MENARRIAASGSPVFPAYASVTAGMLAMSVTGTEVFAITVRAESRSSVLIRGYIERTDDRSFFKE
jgi:hypothetical protein